MKAEFFRPDQPEAVVGTAEWDGGRVLVRAEGDDDRSVLERIFRAVPVMTTDPAARPAGVSADATVEPGDLDWFRAAATVRGEQEGLTVRFVISSAGGWDPAGSYEPMAIWVGRREGDRMRGSLGTSRA